jgi:hypothetical protein
VLVIGDSHGQLPQELGFCRCELERLIHTQNIVMDSCNQANAPFITIIGVVMVAEVVAEMQDLIFLDVAAKCRWICIISSSFDQF